MPQKRPAPSPVHPARTPAPHVQAATARAAQAKLPDRPSSPGHPPRHPPSQASHVQKALAAAQAKLPEPQPRFRPPAAHVRDAVAPIQRKVSMPLPGNRQPAAHVQTVQAKTLDSNRPRVQRSAPFASAIQLATRVLALSDVEVAKYDNPLTQAAVADPGIVLRAKALAAGFGTPLEPIDGANLGTMTKDDDLYIYGHGGYSAGGQMVLTASQLAAKLHGCGLRVVRKLVLKGCQSGSGYIGDVVKAIEAKDIKYHSVEAAVTKGSTDLATGASLALTVASEKRIDDMMAIDRLDPLGGFQQAEIGAEIKTGLVSAAASGAVKVVRSLDSFDPYAHLWS